MTSFHQVRSPSQRRITLDSVPLQILDIDHILKQFVLESLPVHVSSPTTTEVNTPHEQSFSRPSSAGSHRADVSTLKDEQDKQSTEELVNIWDDPFQLLTIHEQTGRIGFAANINSQRTFTTTAQYSHWVSQSLLSPTLSSVQRIHSTKFN